MFNIIEKRAIFFIISAVVIIAGIAGFVINGGFNADIDFTGGTEIYVNLGTEFDEMAIRKSLEGVEGVNISSVQKAEDTTAIVKTTELNMDQKVAAQDAIKKAFEKAEILSVDNVSASIGKDLWNNAAMSIIIASVLMLVYITFRFELLTGISAVLALIHDMLVMMSVYAIFQIPINTSFIAAILTILGYSINATIVVFDRIRENTRFSRKETFVEIANRSIWQTMGRSINTSITTLITLICLYILGVPSIKEFAFPLIVGVVCGCFSSVFLASQFWVLLKGKKATVVAK
jgi:preprotein translocase SecF subunit